MAKLIKIKILKACYQNGRPCKVGDVVEVQETAGREAVWMKKAVLFEEKKVEPPKDPTPPAPTPEPEGDGKKKKGGV